MERPTPEDAAKRIFSSKFPEAKIIFLAGSVVRGEGTSETLPNPSHQVIASEKACDYDQSKE